MKIGVVIPYRETPSRKLALDVVLKWYENNYPGIDIIYADKPGEWQHSGTRNLGVKKAQEAGWDVIIMNDADTIPEFESLQRAISAAMSDKLIHNPYTMCHYLTDEQTQRVIAGEQPFAVGMTNQMSWLCGGVFVFRPEAWWILGGMDEKITTGPEDAAFQRAHQVIHDMNIVKHPGSIYCLSHDRVEKETKEDWDREAYNQNLYQEYLNTTDPKAMLDLVTRRNP